MPEGVPGAPSGGRPAAVTPHAALSRSEGDSRQAAPCGDVVSSRAPPAGAAATYLPGGQPARCTCRSDPPRPASAPAGHTAALPSTHRLPRYPALGLRIDRRRRDRDSRFTRRAGGLKATIAQKPTLERLGVQPEAHERGAAQAAGACSARTLTPACLRMACASSEAGGHHGAVRPPQPRRLRTFRAPSRYARYSRYTQK